VKWGARCLPLGTTSCLGAGVGQWGANILMCATVSKGLASMPGARGRRRVLWGHRVQFEPPATADRSMSAAHVHEEAAHAAVRSVTPRMGGQVTRLIRCPCIQRSANKG